ncbi:MULTISPECIES: MarR family winged helix-turn-helix transcriptional regulator [Delftia]|jgi:DNA-binding MarR family transcriptional regulator|uniref:Transcriptional regulator, MarR family n=4 Tax=Pseudomonadati TaxID=3379134 RepID=A9BSJ2_DELAS|nr:MULTISPECIES: MarR family transcriptional regulator [Delftia]MCP4018766.1 MarR family transcriptional regulator [Delftia sp.]OLE93323.1 MAG: MarR family transcriptional regulator [Delftia sp. 13_1_40CM_3_66_6]ABX33997.1 transcriptional regulator, MarR family [Delftia acidovorans SPH-1]ATH13565.1 MarR family transcriptional regulator [Delftia acidovorans]KFJ11547.1 marR family protein [Delftia acidovorans]
MVHSASDPLSIDLYDQPGHLIRRAQQIAAQLFRDVLGPDVTPVQYAILRMLQEKPGIDQVTLARLVALDNSTTADIAARLEAKGWVLREILPRRQRRLTLTAEGETMLAGFVPNVHELHERMLAALEPQEQAEFKRLLRKFVQLHDARDTLDASSSD